MTTVQGKLATCNFCDRLSAMETKWVPKKEKFAYGFGCFGQNMLYNLMANFLLFFYTDIFGLLPAAAGMILLLARMWDAINDPLMGMIADRTRSRWGKFRPYLLFTPILFVPFAVAAFSTPDFSPGGKIAWAAFTYISFGMIYTASDVPFWAMSSTISEDTKERSSIVAYPRFMATVAIALATLATQPLILLFSVEGKPEWGYQMTSLTYALLTVICFLIAFLFVKERVYADGQEKPRFSEIPKVFLDNKPLLLVILSGLFTGIAQTGKLSMLIYYAKYNLQNELLYTLLAGINIPFILIGIATVPYLTNKVGKKRACIIYYAIFAAGSLGFFLTGWNNFFVLLFFNCISSIGMASPQVIQTAMIADTIEYGELKSGKRNEGTIFSSQTFLAKLTAAVTSIIIASTLSLVGYIPNMAQSSSTLWGIHSLTTLLPFLASIFGIIPILFYPLSEEKHHQIVEELHRRRMASD